MKEKEKRRGGRDFLVRRCLLLVKKLMPGDDVRISSPCLALSFCRLLVWKIAARQDLMDLWASGNTHWILSLRLLCFIIREL